MNSILNKVLETKNYAFGTIRRGLWFTFTHSLYLIFIFDGLTEGPWERFVFQMSASRYLISLINVKLEKKLNLKHIFD